MGKQSLLSHDVLYGVKLQYSGDILWYTGLENNFHTFHTCILFAKALDAKSVVDIHDFTDTHYHIDKEYVLVLDPKLWLHKEQQRILNLVEPIFPKRHGDNDKS